MELEGPKRCSAKRLIAVAVVVQVVSGCAVISGFVPASSLEPARMAPGYASRTLLKVVNSDRQIYTAEFEGVQNFTIGVSCVGKQNAQLKIFVAPDLGGSPLDSYCRDGLVVGGTFTEGLSLAIQRIMVKAPKGTRWSLLIVTASRGTKQRIRIYYGTNLWVVTAARGTKSAFIFHL
jgi:hypothetical protein